MTALNVSAGRLIYELPPVLEAAGPPEAQGRRRDSVRMLVSHTSDGFLEDSLFSSLPKLLEAGDLVVLNTSGTIPAAIDATGEDGTPLVVHFSTQLDDHRWVVEPRRMVGPTTERWRGSLPPRRLLLADGASMVLDQPYMGSNRLWISTLELGEATLAWLAGHGRPIRYGYVDRAWPIDMYQNVYVTEPGSAEMPSAGRPFTPEIITRLVAKGVGVAPIVLHTGVASLEAGELPFPERIRVPESTADWVNLAHREGHRVIAVGTTVVRALESAVDRHGEVRAFDGWTELVITPERGVVAVDGLLTGWHEPASSHLLMLDAIVGQDVLRAAYGAGLAGGYRWHEFGDVHLALP